MPPLRNLAARHSRFARLPNAGSLRLAAATVLVAACGGDDPTGPRAVSIRVDPGSASVEIGETVRFTATALDEEGVVVDGGLVEWESLDEAVATVDATGVVTGVYEGAATIRATIGGLSGTAALTVNVPPGVPGRIDLPGSTSVDPTTLRVLTETGEASPRHDGTFYMETVTSGSSQVDVLSASGDLMLFGMLADDGSTIDVSARATARVLLYYALGVYLLPAERQAAIEAYLAGAPEVDALAGVVEARVADNPLALKDGDPALLAALASARESLLATGAAVSPADVRSVVAPPAGQGAASFTSILIEPTGTPQSGVELVEADAGGAVLGINGFRRPAALLVYRTGTEDAHGNVQDVFPPVKVGQADIAGSGRLGVIETLIDAVQAVRGESPYEAARSEAIPVPPDPSAAKTFYEAVVLGPSFDFVTPMPIRDDPRFFGSSAEWDQIIDDKSLFFFYDGVVAPLIESFAFGAVGVIAADQRAYFVERVSINVNARLQNLGLLLRSQGGYAQALTDLLDELKDGTWRVKNTEYALEALEAGQRAQAEFESIDRRLAARANAAAFLAAVEATLAAIDIGTVFAHLHKSQPAESWRVTSTGPSIRIDPAAPKVTQNQRSVSLDAFVNGFPNSTFRYTWSSTGQNGVLSVVNGGGTSETGSTSTAQYTATVALLRPGPLDDVTVRVEVMNDDTGAYEELGSTTVTVQGPEINYQIAFVPDQQDVRGSESVDFQVRITPPYEGAGVFYRYTTTGRHGTIFPTPGSPSSLDVVTYTANVGAEGQDAITVEVLDETFALIGSATAFANVVPRPDLFVAGAYVIQQDFFSDSAGNPRVCTMAFLTFPIEPDARRYLVRADGYSDWTGVWGTSLNRTFAPPFPAFRPCTVNAFAGSGVSGDTYYMVLSGASGHASVAGDQRTYMDSRFAGMRVDVTIQFR